MIAVTFALRAESSEFLRRLRAKTELERNGLKVVRGNAGHRMVEVLHTGVGEKVCVERVGKFLHDQQFDVLISTGFAGALNDELQPGDLLLAKNFSTIDLDERRLSTAASPIHKANLLTVPELIDSSDERNRIARASGAAAVDMETEFIARMCRERRIPLLSLRVVTDTPQERFPAPAHILFDVAKQRTDLANLAGFFLLHPQRVPRLLKFARRITHARTILANALVDVVEALE